LKKYLPLLAVSLFVCLFVYVFYRTEKTLINQFVIALFSRERYTGLKSSITSMLPLKNYLIYSLPEGLWVFCTTLTSSFFYVEVQNRKWRLEFIPILLALVMELFQLLHFTNGRFDVMDINFSAGFWLLALFYTRAECRKELLFQSFDIRTVSCMISYSIVYLAHVTY
jgi:site-specific recombinase